MPITMSTILYYLQQANGDYDKALVQLRRHFPEARTPKYDDMFQEFKSCGKPTMRYEEGLGWE